MACYNKQCYAMSVRKPAARLPRRLRPASLEQRVAGAPGRAVSGQVHKLEQALTAYGLTPTQYNVLRILRGSLPKSLSIGESGERTIAREPDITRLVDRLYARGFVKLTRSEQDRRVVEVEITRKGLDLLQGLEPHSARMPRALMGHVAPQRLRQLSKLLAEVLDGMGEYP